MIEKYKNPIVVAEIGINHMGDFELAKSLIQASADAGAQVAKFQKRSLVQLRESDEFLRQRDCQENSFGKTELAHREFLEFDINDHKRLQNYCRQCGIEYSASVWDEPSAREIITLSPPVIKVPSAINNNIEVLQILRDEYDGEVHVSLGMTTLQEEHQIVSIFEQKNQAKSRLVLYACTSDYPAKATDVSLLEITRMQQSYRDRIFGVGFSGHHLGIALDISAYTLGAYIIERHFTLDKEWKGSDQFLSLNKEELKQLVCDLSRTHQALGYKAEKILEGEKKHRKRLGKSITENSAEIKLFLSDIDGTLTDGGMYYAESGDELKKFCTADGVAFEQLRSRGIRVGLITGEECQLNDRRGKKLQVDHYYYGIKNKLECIKKLLLEKELSLDEIAYIGDDINDYELLAKVGLSACPSDANDRVKNIPGIYICKKSGGSGAVREFVHYLLDKNT